MKIIETPLGHMLLEGRADKLTQAAFTGTIPALPLPESAVEQAAAEQLEEYFAGKRYSFSISLAPEGTPFQLGIWKTLVQIPYGTTVSYGELAARAGVPSAVRAAGGACHNNPIAILIPCHRVIGKNGSLTGYAAGMERKRFLLQSEQNHFCFS